MYNIEFTKEEGQAILIQVGGRIDALKDLQIQAGKKGNIERVLELEEFMKPIISFKEKVEKEIYS